MPKVLQRSARLRRSALFATVCLVPLCTGCATLYSPDPAGGLRPAPRQPKSGLVEVVVCTLLEPDPRTSLRPDRPRVVVVTGPCGGVTW